MAHKTITIITVLAFASHVATENVCKNPMLSNEVRFDCHRKVLHTIPAEVPDTVTHLDMSQNIVENITPEILERFPKLEMLNLSTNFLTIHNFPANLLESTDIRILDLSKNRLRGSLRPHLLDGSMKLETLRLDYNSFSHVPEDVLVNMSNLKKLSMSYCDIETISPRAFQSIGSELKQLDLSNNMLETLSKDLSGQIFTNSLNIIRLYGNFWSCDCHLKWLREAVQTNGAYWSFQSKEGGIPTCEEPKPLKHRNWQFAASEKFGCGPTIQPVEPVKAQLNSDVTLTCKAETYGEKTEAVWIKGPMIVVAKYTPGLSITEAYNGSIFITNLKINGVQQKDFDDEYQCIVNTSFGTAQQTLRLVKVKTPNPFSSDKGVIAAIAVTVLLVVLILLVLGCCYVRKRLSYRGKLYTDKDASERSEIESTLPGDGDDVTLDTVSQPDVIKCYPEDGLEVLPAETEYPVDDAGCKEYNEYLDATKVPLTVQAPGVASSSSSTASPVRYSPTEVRYSPTSDTVRVSPAGRVNTPPRNSPLLQFIKEEDTGELL